MTASKVAAKVPVERSETNACDAARRNVVEMRQRDARGRKTMQALHQALLDMIEDQPVERITVDALIARAGVGKATYYRHYSSKEALIEEVATEQIDQLVAMSVIFLSVEDTLSNCLKVVRYVNDHRKLWSVLLTGGASGVMRRRLAEIAQSQGTLAGASSADLPVELCASWGVAATVEVLVWWLRQERDVPLEEVARLLDRLAVKPALPQRRS